jgi:hypothetical protein
MASRLLRRLRRNVGSVLSVLVRDVLLRGKNLLGLTGAAVGLGALAQGVGAVLAGALVSAAVFGLVGGAALYGATESFLGAPLRGASVLLAGLLIVGGGAYALGVGPAATGSDTPTDDAGLVSDDTDSGSSWTDEGHGRVPPRENTDDGGSTGFQGGGCADRLYR